jgi:hypothetical protein
MGFICLLPGLRRPIAKWIIRQGVLKAMPVYGRSAGADRRPGTPGTTIDGDFIEEDR